MTSHTSIFIVLLTFASGIYLVSANSSDLRGGEDWQTLEFILPDDGDRYGAGKYCYNLSSSFCLHGYWYNSPQGVRKEQQDDLEVWTELIENKWRHINWFSFDARSFGTCCNFQVHEYMSHGRNFGVSPKEYYKRVTDFSIDNKHLNRIKARYDKDIGLNIISELGFGPDGDLIMDGAKSDHDFMLPPKLDMDDIRFPFENVENFLTFEWFKEKIMCLGQPWICQN